MGVEKKLDTPQNLSIDGDILSWDPVENATSYDIYVDNEVAATVTVASKANNLTAFLTGIANALRAKKGTTELINPQDFESEITSIQTGSTITLQTKAATPTKNTQTITPDASYGGLSSVTVHPIPDEYIITSDATATASDIKKDKSAYVNGVKLQGTFTAPTTSLQNKTITPTKSEQTIRADAGYDGLESVKVEAIPSKYIDTTSGTATGADILKGKTAYAKGALITGTLTASSITIAVNGTTSSETTGTLYNEITVRVPTKGGITEISTTDEMNSLLQDETNIGKMYRYVGVTNSTYTKGDIYEVAVL